jgi:hypothetical protein
MTKKVEILNVLYNPNSELTPHKAKMVSELNTTLFEEASEDGV